MRVLNTNNITISENSTDSIDIKIESQCTGTFTGYGISHWILLNNGAYSLQIFFANTYAMPASPNCVIDGVNYRFRADSATSFVFNQVPFGNINISNTINIRPFLVKIIESGYATHLLVAVIHTQTIIYGTGTAIISQ